MLETLPEKKNPFNRIITFMVYSRRLDAIMSVMCTGMNALHGDKSATEIGQDGSRLVKMPEHEGRKIAEYLAECGYLTSEIRSIDGETRSVSSFQKERVDEKFYKATFKGIMFYGTGGFTWRAITEFSKVLLRFSISFAVCMATIFGAIYSSKQSNIQTLQYQLQKEFQIQSEKATDQKILIRKQQQIIDSLSKLAYQSDDFDTNRHKKK